MGREHAQDRRTARQIDTVQPPCRTRARVRAAAPGSGWNGRRYVVTHVLQGQ